MFGISKKFCDAVFKDLEYRGPKEEENYNGLQMVLRVLQEKNPRHFAMYKLRVLGGYQFVKIGEMFGITKVDAINACENIRKQLNDTFVRDSIERGISLNDVEKSETSRELYRKYGRIKRKRKMCVLFKVTDTYYVKA